MKRNNNICKVFLISLIVMGVIFICGCNNKSKNYYNKILSDEEIKLLDKDVVTIEILEKVVGEIDELKDIGFGKYIYAANCERFGYIYIEFENPREQTNIIKCTVNGDKEYVLFEKLEY